MFSRDEIDLAARISRFMRNLWHVDRPRFQEATRQCIPFGDVAYAQAILHWKKGGRNANAFFSWADSEHECPLTIAFRKEIGTKFGLPILTKDEARAKRRQYRQILNHKVNDWGLN